MTLKKRGTQSWFDAVRLVRGTRNHLKWALFLSGLLLGEYAGASYPLARTTSEAGTMAVVLVTTNPRPDYALTTVSDGVMFDVEGTGVKRRVAWTARGADVAFLARDTDGDGLIGSVKELITSRSVSKASNGFIALQKLAMQSNGGIERGSVTMQDPLFSELLLWTDRNHNGISERSELAPVGASLSAIGLGYGPLAHEPVNGNVFHFRGWAHIRTGPGQNDAISSDDNRNRSRDVWEVFLNTE